MSNSNSNRNSGEKSKLQAARDILETLRAAGHEAWFVGGFVRDQLLGRAIKDIDLATSALPDEVRAIFPHTVATGLQHGTVSVIIDRVAYEVTTFRAEAGYEDARRPQSVTFIRDLQADLERRDFTINAMAMGPGLETEVIDPFAGRADLQAGIVRAVGRAEARFNEDALRMMRCLRFAANLGFRIEEETWQALLACRQGLQHISIERVRMELDNMLEGPHPGQALQLLGRSGLAAHFRAGQAIADSLPHALVRVTQMDGQSLASAVARWVFFFLNLQIDADEARTICRAFTHANKKTDEIVAALRLSAALRQACQVSNVELGNRWKEAVIAFGRAAADTVLELARNAVRVQGGRLFSADDDERTLEGVVAVATNGMKWMEEMNVYTLRDLAINGNDLMKHVQRKTGAWLKPLLQRLLLAVALGELANERQALLTMAERVLADYERLENESGGEGEQ